MPSLRFAYRTVYSVKVNLGGLHQFELNNSISKVPVNNYIIVNNDQDIACLANESTSAFSIFLEPSLLTDVFRNLSLADDALLTNPFEVGFKKPLFYEHIYPIDGNSLGRCLSELGGELENNGGMGRIWTVDVFYQIAEALILSQQETFKQIRAIRAIKKSTKNELYGRMLDAKSFLHANLNSNVSLETLAETTLMSPFHFHRTFRSTFGITPARYLTRLRMAEATSLLRSRNLSVSDVAKRVGFEDIFGFSRAFKRETGLAPSKLASEGKLFS